MKKIIFVTGGARSGKSRFAIEHSAVIPGRKAFIATAEYSDEEMQRRIEKHKFDRGEVFDTFEIPTGIADVLRELEQSYQVIVIDCLTLWTANLMSKNLRVEDEFSKFIGVLQCLKGDVLVFIVSNEVGMGIVPENGMARNYRDLAGFLNQKVAEAADEVYLTVSGIPLKIK